MCTYVPLYVCIYVCMHVYIYVSKYYVCIYLCICTFFNMCECIYVKMYVCAYLYIYLCRICIYMCIYIYILCVCVCVCGCVCFSHEQIATAYTFWSSQFAPSPSSLYLLSYLVIQRRQLKCGCTQELPWDGYYQIESHMFQSFVIILYAKLYIDKVKVILKAI